MLYTATAVERRNHAASVLLPAPAERELRPAAPIDRRDAAERELDQVLADSFPASDPPSWTPGVARAELFGSAPGSAGSDATPPEGDDVEPVESHVVDVSLPRDTGRPLLRGLAALAGAAGLALLVPFVILLVGLPFVLAVRGIADAAAWLLARIAG